MAIGEPATPENHSVIAKSASYGLPGTSTQEVVLTYSAVQSFDSFAMTGMDTWPVLTVKFYEGVTLNDTQTLDGQAIKSDAEARSTCNLVDTFTAVDADSIEITFGTEYPSTFSTVFAGAKILQFSKNYTLDSTDEDSPVMSEFQAGMSHYVKATSHQRIDENQYQILTDADIKTLRHAQRTISDNACLYMRDPDDNDPEEWYIAQLINVGKRSYLSNDQYSTNITIREIRTCG